MSVVVLKKYEDRIEISSDSCVSNGVENIDHQNGACKKLIRINDIIVGGCGDLYEVQLLQYYLKTYEPKLASQYDLQKLIYNFIQYKRKGLGIVDRLKHKFFYDNRVKNSYIFVFNNQCFYVEGTVISLIKNMYAIGSGKLTAYAALRVGMSPHDAVEMSCKYNFGVSEPIIDEIYYIKC